MESTKMAAFCRFYFSFLEVHLQGKEELKKGKRRRARGRKAFWPLVSPHWSIFPAVFWLCDGSGAGRVLFFQGVQWQQGGRAMGGGKLFSLFFELVIVGPTRRLSWEG
jgi:hypothetical protein